MFIYRNAGATVIFIKNGILRAVENVLRLKKTKSFLSQNKSVLCHFYLARCVLQSNYILLTSVRILIFCFIPQQDKFSL